MSIFLENILLGLSLAAPIGPVTIVVANHALKRGFKGGFFASLGVAASDLTTVGVIYLGLSFLIGISWLNTLIALFGAFVLSYLGISNIKDFLKKKSDSIDPISIKKNPFLEAFITASSNPMSRIWWLGIFGPMVTSSPSKTLAAGSIIALGELLFFILLCLLLHWGKRFINEKTMKVITLIAGICLIFFGLRLAYQAFELI